MTTMVENEKSSGQRPGKPNREVEVDLGSAAARFDKVEADMREGFARIDQDIRGLRGEMKAQGDSLRGEITALGDRLRDEMNTRFLALEVGFGSLQRTLIGSAIGGAGAIVAALIGVKVF